MSLEPHIALIAILGATIGIAVVAIVAIFLSNLPIVERLLVAAAPAALIAMMWLALVGASLEQRALEMP